MRRNKKEWGKPIYIGLNDLKQREALARELQKTKCSIPASNLRYRLDKIRLIRDLSKMLTHVVETEKEAA